MNSPKVTVCIPVYNEETFLPWAIESVLAQTFADFEVIILDNASTDGTPDVVRKFHDSRIRVIRHATNIGAVSNFNAGLREARGEWVKIVCADDLLYPQCLEKQFGTIATSPIGPPVMICCARDIVDEQGRRWLRRSYPGRGGWISGSSAIRRTIRSGTNIFGEPVAVLIRREVALRTGGFDGRYRYCVDLDLWVRILQSGNIYVGEESLCAFRVSSGSWSLALAHSQANEFAEWMQKCCENKALNVTVADKVFGLMKACLWMWLRFLFYRFLFGASKPARDGKDNR